MIQGILISAAVALGRPPVTPTLTGSHGIEDAGPLLTALDPERGKPIAAELGRVE